VIKPPIDVTITIFPDPRFTICRANPCVSASVPKTFVSKFRRTFSIGISAAGPVCITPALLISTSTSFANAACRSPSSVMSSTWIFSCTPASSAIFISSVTCGAICTPAITV
jgi:hypothetical protein